MTLLVTPDQREPTRRSRLGAPLGTAAALGIATLALRLRDPHQHGSWGFCPLQVMTGWDCPGCGGLRAVNDLTHGHVLDAVHSNLLFVGLLPLIGLGWVLWVFRRWTSDAPLLSARAVRLFGYALGVAAVVFAVLRNTPWGQAFSVS